MQPGGRREYLLLAGTLVGGASIVVGSQAVVSGDRSGVPYDGRKKAGFKTYEPIVTDVNVSSSSSSKNSYVSLIRTQEEADERYRVDYLKDEFDIDVSDLYKVDYENEFLAIVGHVLPKNKELNLKDVEYRDDTLSMSCEISESSGPKEPKIHHNLVIYRQGGQGPPNSIDAEFTTGVSGK